jgi:hypothetical protein
MFTVLLPKMDALANIPKGVAEKKMAQTKSVLHMFIGQFVNEADTNGDGKLSLAENKAYKPDVMKMQQDIRQMVAKAKAEEARNMLMIEF